MTFDMPLGPSDYRCWGQEQSVFKLVEIVHEWKPGTPL